VDLQCQCELVLVREGRQEAATVLDDILFAVVVKTGKAETVFREG